MTIKIKEIPQQAIDLIREFEGCILHKYLDQAGLETIGIGHLVKKGEDFSDGVTEIEAKELLRKDLYSAACSVCKLTNVTLSDNQYGALLSFTFNLGGGSYQCSTLRSKLNRGEYESAGEEFPKWCWVSGKKSKGLLRRRLAERDLFLS